MESGNELSKTVSSFYIATLDSKNVFLIFCLGHNTRFKLVCIYIEVTVPLLLVNLETCSSKKNYKRHWHETICLHHYKIYSVCLMIHALQVATFIVQKILLDELGLQYICQMYERFFSVATVLTSMVQGLVEQPSARLLKHVVRCYLRLSDNPRYVFSNLHCFYILFYTVFNNSQLSFFEILFCHRDSCT